MYKKIKFVVFIFVITLITSSCSNKETIKFEKYSHSFFGVFDTEITFTAYTKNEEEFKKYSNYLESEFKRYHELYSSFENYSVNNIKTINDNAGVKAVIVDDEIIDLLNFSISMYEKISTKNNISIGRVTSLWREQKDLAVDLKGKLPDDKQIKDALKHIDMKNIEIDKKHKTVYLKDKDMLLDVGATAKGYAVEKIMNKLKDMGLENAIISAGGNVKSIGSPQEQDRKKWGVGIQNPEIANQSVELKEVLFTDETSAVTSGDYQRFYYVDDKMYNHIIDPDTGYPNNKIRSVTVLYSDSAVADFLSTSLFLMDIEEGKEVLNKVEGAKAYWILPDGNVEYTEGMEKLLKSEGAKNN